MRWLHRTIHFLRGLVGRRRQEAELDEELRACVDILSDRHVARGLTPEAARRAAAVEFEGIEQVKENVRDVRLGIALETLGQDLRYALRALRRTPAFTAVAVATLALGIGINTAVFSVVYAELLRPLPYANPDRLALVWSHYDRSGVGGHSPASGPMVAELARRSRLLEGVAAIWVGNGTFTGGDNPEQVKLGQVTTNFFSLLGVRPALGRFFLPDEKFTGHPLLVISYGFWKRRFGGDPAIAGKTVDFQGRTATVIGVLPEDFRLYFPPDSNVPRDVPAFVPFGDITRFPRTLYYLRPVARLKPGVTQAQAQADMDAVAGQIRAAYTEFASEDMHFQVDSMREDAVQEVRPALVALFAGAGFVLLICCTNVANLLLARANDSRRAIALRAALGASNGRIARQLLGEGGLLCAGGAAAGAALAWAGIRWLVRLRPDHLSRIQEATIDWPVLAFVAAIAVVSVLLFALAPTIELLKWDLLRTIREAHSSPSRTSRAMRSTLIVAEITLGFVLVIGAGLMIRTMANIHRVNPGFEPRRLLTFEVEMPGRNYAKPGAMENFAREWASTLRALPGVEAAGGVSHLPLDDYPNWYSPYRPADVPEKEAGAFIADHRCVTPDYFRAMGTRLLEGRYFTDDDRNGGREVVIVDEMLARATWPGQSAIGKRVESEHFTPRGIVPVMSEVVGVVEHVRNHSLSQQLRGEIYMPFEQSARSHLSWAVRTSGDPLALTGAVRGALHRRDPLLAASKMRPMTAYVEKASAPAEFTAVLAGVFAALALLLAAIGIYGVISYSVSQRMHEMGVRMALGASGSDVLRLVMREGLWLTAAGVAIGAAGAVELSRFLTTMIYGVSPLDPAAYAAAFTVIPAAALLGCWRPARRAASATPPDTIRAD
jgi:putative ABC transport system permease protein